jgi:hypothetical protein
MFYLFIKITCFSIKSKSFFTQIKYLFFVIIKPQNIKLIYYFFLKARFLKYLYFFYDKLIILVNDIIIISKKEQELNTSFIIIIKGHKLNRGHKAS